MIEAMRINDNEPTVMATIVKSVLVFWRVRFLRATRK